MKWADRIRAARERGAFTPTDVEDVSGWCGCFVGEVTEGRSPVRLSLPPRTYKALEVAGVDAVTAVMTNNFAAARKLLAQIKRIASSKTFKSALRKVRRYEREADREIGGSL